MVEGSEQFAGGKVFDEAAVGSKEVVRGEFFELDPLELVKDFVFEFAFERGNSIELQVDSAAMAVVVADVGDVGTDGGADAELFVEFAGEGLLGALAVFDLAAGKLPLKGHRLVWAALADEDEAVAHEQAGDDESESWARRTWFGDGLRVFHASSVNGE